MRDQTKNLDLWEIGNKERNRGSGQNSNINNTMLGFNDDYNSLLTNLSSSNTHTGVNGDNKYSRSGNYGTSNQDNDKNGVACKEKADNKNLDILLERSQGMIPPRESKNARAGESSQQVNAMSNMQISAGPSADDSRYMIADKPCDHCRRRQMECLVVAGLSNCIQCEAKGIKCALSALPSTQPVGFEQQQIKKRSRSDENYAGVYELLKRSKGNNNMQQGQLASYYSDMLQNLTENFDGGGNNANEGIRSTHDTGSSGAKSLPNQASRYNAGNGAMGRGEFVHSAQTVQYPRSSFYVGPTSVFDTKLINHMKLDKIDQVQLSKTLALRKVAQNVQFILRADFNQQMYLKHEVEIDMVERLVHPHGKVLVDIFFKLIHPYFPILHEGVFLEKYTRSYRELTAPVLASIYSLALRWWDFHPKLVGFPKPCVADKLNEIALKTFYDVLERPKLSIVQTGLLLLQCRSECPNNWILCSQVVALSEDLGLGIDCQDWRLPRWERGLRRRLAWAVWYQDKWTSLMESRYSHLILGRNWLVNMLKEDDFPSSSPIINGEGPDGSFRNGEEKDRNSTDNIAVLDLSPTEEDFNNGKLIFKQMISLSIILGEILDTFYTLGAISTTSSIEQVLKLAKPLQLKLREWYHSLPSSLSMNYYQPRRFNCNATLTLAYFAAEITLHRKIISTLKSDDPIDLVQVCRTAAKTRLIAAIEFVRDLKTEHTSAFWYTCSTGNLTLISTFAGLLYVTALSKDDAKIYRDCLRNYVWILRIASKTFEKAEHALERIQMLLSQIPGLLTDEKVQNFIPPRSQSPYVNQQQPHTTRSVHSGSTSGSPYTESNSGSNGGSSLQNGTYQQLKALPPDILDILKSVRKNVPTMTGDGGPAIRGALYADTQRGPEHVAANDVARSDSIKSSKSSSSNQAHTESTNVSQSVPSVNVNEVSNSGADAPMKKLMESRRSVGTDDTDISPKNNEAYLSPGEIGSTKIVSASPKAIPSSNTELDVSEGNKSLRTPVEQRKETGEEVEASLSGVNQDILDEKQSR